MKFKNSIMTKMLIMFFAATIPLYAVGLALYNTSGRRLSMETLETKQSQIEFYLQSLEDDLERLFSLETELINDSAVGSLATRYDYFSIYEQGSRINTLRDRLSGICKSSAYAVTTSIYLRPMQMKLNDASGLDLMTSEDESFIAELKRNPRSAMRMDEDALYSVVCIRNTMNEPYYTLATEISRKKLREDLLNLESGVPADCLIVFDGDNVLASSSERARTLWKQAGSQMESLPSRGIRRASISVLYHQRIFAFPAGENPELCSGEEPDIGCVEIYPLSDGSDDRGVLSGGGAVYWDSRDDSPAAAQSDERLSQDPRGGYDGQNRSSPER